MPRTKPKPKYQAVSLPKNFLKKVRQHVLSSDDYKSIAEFTHKALEEKIQNDETIRLKLELNESFGDIETPVSLIKKVNNINQIPTNEIIDRLDKIIELLKHKKTK